MKGFVSWSPIATSRKCLGFLVLFLTLGASLNAQGYREVIVGQVFNQSSAVLPKVAITVVRSPQIHHGKSGATGR